MRNISVTILTKNSEKHLENVLKALQRFEEIVVCDTGSTDQTDEIAKKFPNVRWVEEPFTGFGPTHNAATAHASNDWILSIDSDEVVSDALRQEIEHLILQPNTIYSVPRKNYFNGKWIRGCGWYPDRVFRLYHRKHAHFCDSKVHEKLIGESLKKKSLKEPLLHTPYDSIEDFLRKMQLYSSLFAKQQRGKRSGGLAKAIWHGFFAFIKSYFIKRGIFDGREGLMISLYNAHTAYYKYLKLDGINGTGV